MNGKFSSNILKTAFILENLLIMLDSDGRNDSSKFDQRLINIPQKIAEKLDGICAKLTS
jgi:hypothetical protein